MRSMVMDYISIPHFATFREFGTVIVRIKMDGCDTCSGSPKRVAAIPDPAHRPSGCEKCTRNRLDNKYSDCDSELVGSCRPYSSINAKSSKPFLLNYNLSHIYFYLKIWKSPPTFLRHLMTSTYIRCYSNA